MSRVTCAAVFLSNPVAGPTTLPSMCKAVLTRAKRSHAFRAKVDRAALLVLRTKESHHLLGR